MPRRIALVVPAFPRLSETFIVNKFLGLLERGWDVHVVCNQSDDSEWANFAGLEGNRGLRSRVHVAWPHRPRWAASLLLPAALVCCLLASPRRSLRYAAKGWRLFGPGVLRRFYLDAELIRLGCDIVHFEFGALAPGRMDLQTLLGCSIVVSFRGYDLNYVGLDRPHHYGEVWNRAAVIHLLGRDLWHRALRRGCPPDKPHALIPPAIDAEFFRPDEAGVPRAEEPGRPVRILSVGRLEWKKGYEDALVAVRKLRERGIACEYRIVGDGDYLGAIAFGRHQLGLEDIVSFLGSASRDEVRTQMQAADLLLHAAVSEGFCNAVLEAQAMKLPVVCTDADGLPENVEDGVTGFVVPRRNPESLAERMAVLALDPGLRRKMGEAGRQRVISRFRLEDQITAFEALYRGVLEGLSEVSPAASEGLVPESAGGRSGSVRSGTARP